MKLKGRKSILAAVLAVCFFIVPGSIFAGAYDGTKINADLNAFNKPDHITLTWTDNPATTMTITWRTDSSVKTCKVEYGSMGKDTDKLSLISPVQPTVFKTSAADSVSGKMHIFKTTLTGLKPGAHYIYRIGNDNKVVVFGNYAAGSSSTEEEMSREISVDILSIMASPADTMRSLIWFLSKDKFLQACR